MPSRGPTRDFKVWAMVPTDDRGRSYCCFNERRRDLKGELLQVRDNAGVLLVMGRSIDLA